MKRVEKLESAACSISHATAGMKSPFTLHCHVKFGALSMHSTAFPGTRVQPHAIGLLYAPIKSSRLSVPTAKVQGRNLLLEICIWSHVPARCSCDEMNETISRANVDCIADADWEKVAS